MHSETVKFTDKSVVKKKRLETHVQLRTRKLP